MPKWTGASCVEMGHDWIRWDFTYLTSIYSQHIGWVLQRIWCSFFSSITFSNATFWENNYYHFWSELEKFLEFSKKHNLPNLNFMTCSFHPTCRQLCRPILDDRDVLAVAPRGVFWWKFLFMPSQPTPTNRHENPALYTKPMFFLGNWLWRGFHGQPFMT